MNAADDEADHHDRDGDRQWPRPRSSGRRPPRRTLVLSLGPRRRGMSPPRDLPCAQARFDAMVGQQSHGAGRRRFAAYAEVLRGLRAFFHAENVSREAFDRFAEALSLRGHYPGFQVLNYAPHVPAASRNAFEKSISTAPSWPVHLRFSIHSRGNAGRLPLA
jgi:hypothetical protein